MDRASSNNVAVVQPLPGIGDMIWHLPHIRAIAAHVDGGGLPSSERIDRFTSGSHSARAPMSSPSSAPQALGPRLAPARTEGGHEMTQRAVGVAQEDGEQSSHSPVGITLVAKPRSLADQIFAAEPAVRDVLWVDRNPEGRRGRHDGTRGWLRLVESIRARRFSAVYVLHHSQTLAFLMLAAGIPVRHGYGYGTQRLFLNRGPYLPRSVFPLHPFEQASTWLAAADIPLSDAEPVLAVSPAARDAVRARLGSAWGGSIAIGVGSSEPYKQWGTERFVALAIGLRAAGWQNLVLVGGKAEASLIETIRAQAGDAGRDAIPAIGWTLSELAALFEAAEFYVGNDTGVMNMAAAVGTRTYALFGATPPFHHSTRIVPIVPPGGMDKITGMARITPQAVFDAICIDRGRLPPKA
jgi:heptosyltransferase II